MLPKRDVGRPLFASFTELNFAGLNFSGLNFAGLNVYQAADPGLRVAGAVGQSQNTANS